MPTRRHPQRPGARRNAVFAAVLAAGIGLGCESSPDLAEPSDAVVAMQTMLPRASGNTTRLTVSPTDTLRLGPVGATGTLTVRAWAGTQEVATPIKWWIRQNKVASLSSTLCTSPCSVTVTARELGSSLVDVHEYVNGTKASRDQVVIAVTNTPSESPPELAGLVVTPASATLAPGASQQLSALGRLSDGSTSEVAVTWTASGGTIDPTGLYTAGQTAGTYRVVAKASTGALADTTAMTITSTAPPTGSAQASCFDRGSPTRTVSTTFSVNQTYDHRADIASSERIDASTARWSKNARTGDYMVRLGTGSNICWSGGLIKGLWDQRTEPWETYHSSNGFTGDGPNMVFENIRVENYGDGVKWLGAATNWTVRRAHFIDIHDDCVETDWMYGGRIEDVLFEGCFTFVATRPRQSVLSTVDGRNDTIYINKAIVWHKGFPTHGAGRFWKIDTYHTPPWGPWHVITNSIVRMDPGQSSSRYCLNEGGIVKRAENNIVVWTGSGEMPCSPLPKGWTLTRDVGVYERAVADWKDRHPGL